MPIPHKAHPDKGHIFFEHVRLPDKGVDADADQKGIPQHVGDDKPLAKGNEVVQRQIGYPVLAVAVDDLLNDKKGGEIDRHDQQIPQVGGVTVPGSGHRQGGALLHKP